jgi:hypothetical protein
MWLPMAGKTLKGEEPRKEQVRGYRSGACAEREHFACGVVLVTLCRGAKACERISWRSRKGQEGQWRKNLRVEFVPEALSSAANNDKEGPVLTQ